MRKIKQIIVHCTDSPDYMDIGVAEINSWHLQHGWNGIGYHYVFRRNGDCETGRHIGTKGSHAYGFNSNSIGIVWVGQSICTSVQWWNMAVFCAELMETYDIAIHQVLGHNELPGVTKTCPNINTDQLRSLIQTVREFGPDEIQNKEI